MVTIPSGRRAFLCLASLFLLNAAAPVSAGDATQGGDAKLKRASGVAAPAGIKDGAVTIVTAKSFDSVVMDADRDVLLNVYSPRCGWCKKLTPIYHSLAEALVGVDSLTIAKIDATVETVKGLTIKGYPTVLFYAANNKTSPIKYTEKRTVEEFMSFLEKHASKPFVAPKVAEAPVAYKSEDVLPEDTTGPVTVIRGKSFQQIVMDSNKDVFVEYYAPWCGWCKKIAPIWDTLGSTFAGVDSVTIAKMDATANEAEGVKVKGFPTLMFYPANNKKDPIKYSGERTVADFAAFIKEHASTPITIDLPEVPKVDKASLKSEEVLPADMEGPVKVVKGKSFDSIVMESNKDVFVEFYAPWCGWCKKIAPMWDELGSTFAGVDSVTIAKMDATANEAEGVKVKGFPTLMFYPANNKKAPIKYSGERTVADFAAFIKEHAHTPITIELPEVVKVEKADKADKGAKGGLKSEEVVPADMSGPVKVVKGKSFDNIVLDSNKDVFVEFYAPWCGWCKKIAPMWDELGSAFEGIDTVTIAKMDATANEVAGLQVKGFPTLMFYPANNKKAPIKYSGERTVADFSAFVKEHASKPITRELSVGAVKAEKVQVEYKSEELLVSDLRGAVKVVRGKSFQKIVMDTNRDVFVEYYAPWCGWCKKIAPEWEKLGKLFEGDSNVIIAKMDATVNEAEGLKIEGFPTLMFYPAKAKSAPIEFNGERTVAGFAAFIKEHASKPIDRELPEYQVKYKSEKVLPEDMEGPVKVVKGDSFKDIVMDSNKDVFVEYHAPWCGFCKDIAPEWEKLGSTFEGVDTITIAKMDGTENEAEGLKLEGFPTLLFYPANNKKEPVEFTGDRTVAGFAAFIKEHATTPITIELPEQQVTYKSEDVLPEDMAEPVKVVKGNSFRDIVMDSTKDVFVDYYAPWCGYCKEIAPEWEKLGTAFEGVDSVTIAKMDGTENEAEGLKLEGFPTLLFYPANNKEPIEFSGERTVAHFVAFIKQRASTPVTLDNPEYQLTYKSEEVLPEDLDEAVKIVKGNSFQDIVMDTTQDVFLEYYAPWCGWCKKIAPMWESLGEAFEEIDSVTIAKMDGTLNEVEGLAVSGFPTLLFYPADAKDKPITYTGERTVANFAAFVKEHASTPIDIDDLEFEVAYESEEVLPEDMEGAVKVVKGKSFKDIVIDSNKDVFVEYYAPWCGFCKDIAPEWEKLGEAFEGIDSVTIAKMDGTANEAEGLKLEGFPTMMFYPANNKGEPIEFSGGERTVASFVAFVKEHASTPFTLDHPEFQVTYKSEEVVPEDMAEPVKVVKGKSFQDIVMDSSKDVFVKYYAPWCGWCKKIAPEWEKLGSIFEDVDTVTIAKMDATENEAEGLKIEGFPTLMFYPAHGKSAPIEFNGERTVAGFAAFIKEHASAPITIELPEYQVTYKSEEVLPEDLAEPVKVVRGNSFKDIVMDSNKDVFVEYYAPWCGWCKELAPIWDTVGSAFEGIDSVTIAKMDGTENEAEGLKLEGFPTLLFYPANNKKEPVEFSGERTVAHFVTFVKEHASIPVTLDNPEYEVTYKSEEVVPEDMEGPVKVVKGTSFQDIVMDTTKDVFLEYYAPWCGWCKKIEPMWETLGVAFEGVDSVTIAKIDGTANDVKGLKASSFPTLLFYPANAKDKPITYTGERTPESFLAFLKEHASTPFSVELPSSAKDDL